MGWRDGRRSFQETPDRLFHLCLVGIAVSSKNPFDLTGLKFHGRDPASGASQQGNAADPAQRNTRLGILLQRKDAFNDNEVGFFRLENGAQFRKNVVKSESQFLALGSPNGAKGMSSDKRAIAFDDSKAGISQARIYAYDL